MYISKQRCIHSPYISYMSLIWVVLELISVRLCCRFFPDFLKVESLSSKDALLIYRVVLYILIKEPGRTGSGRWKTDEYFFKVRDFISLSDINMEQASLGKYPLSIPRLQHWGISGSWRKTYIIGKYYSS